MADPHWYIVGGRAYHSPTVSAAHLLLTGVDNVAKKNSKINGGFVLKPKNTIRCKQYKELKSSSKVVYEALLTEFIRDKKINPDNKVKMTQSQIEKLTGLSHATIWRGIKELKAKEFIHVQEDEQGGLERNYTTYRLNGRYLY